MHVPDILTYIPPSIEEARKIQRQLAQRVQIVQLKTEPQTAVAVDVAYNNNTAFCACVVWDIKQNRQIDSFVVSEPVRFPYIPTLLSFREAPSIAKALKQLSLTPDLLFVDGQGIAHPLKVGIATHIGVALNIPSIGVAKSILFGKVIGKIDGNQGSKAPIANPNTKEIIGMALRTRSNVKPVYVSPGNLLTVEEATQLTLQVCSGFRLPEPLRIADKLSKRAAHGYPSLV